MDVWQEVKGKLTGAFEFPGFLEAMAFVNKVVEAAELVNHHPDIHIHYTKVTLELWTHSAGRVTDKDRKLAETITGLV